MFCQITSNNPPHDRRKPCKRPRDTDADEEAGNRPALYVKC